MNRRELAFEIAVNGVLPYLVYEQSKARFGANETEALLWATVVPGVVVIVGLVRQRKLDPIAVFTLVTLLISIALAAATDDPRLLQLRESYLSAGLGALMLLSAILGRPLLTSLAPRLLPPDKQALAGHPLMRKLLTRLTWIWGFLFAGELALKWWMVETLTIGQVLALGPVVFGALTGLGCLLTLAAARTLRPRRETEPANDSHPIPLPETTYLPEASGGEGAGDSAVGGAQPTADSELPPEGSLARTASVDIET